MDFTESESPNITFGLLIGVIYLTLNIVFLTEFLKLTSISLVTVSIGFIASQIISFSVLLLIRESIEDTTVIILSLWTVLTKTKSSKVAAVRAWSNQFSGSASSPKVLGVNPDLQTGEIEIEVLSNKGFGFIYGDITDLSNNPDGAEFIHKSQYGSGFTECYFCAKAGSDFRTSVHYTDNATCSHQSAVCEECVTKILVQTTSEVEDKDISTEELVANQI